MSQLDEISQMAEKLCSYLDELTEDEKDEIIEHYFADYFRDREHLVRIAKEQIKSKLLDFIEQNSFEPTAIIDFVKSL